MTTVPETTKTVNPLLSECAELPNDLDGMDTLTLRLLRDSQHEMLSVATSAMLDGVEGSSEAVREIGARLRQISNALDRKDGMEADR